MSEFFLELFSEEIPSSLQKNARDDLLRSFNDLFLEKSIAENTIYRIYEFMYLYFNRLRLKY